MIRPLEKQRDALTRAKSKLQTKRAKLSASKKCVEEAAKSLASAEKAFAVKLDDLNSIITVSYTPPSKLRKPENSKGYRSSSSRKTLVINLWQGFFKLLFPFRLNLNSEAWSSAKKIEFREQSLSLHWNSSSLDENFGVLLKKPENSSASHFFRYIFGLFLVKSTETWVWEQRLAWV